MHPVRGWADHAAARGQAASVRAPLRPAEAAELCATRVFTTYIHTNKRYKGEHRPVHCTGIETVRRSEDRRAERSSQAATAHGADRGAHLKTR